MNQEYAYFDYNATAPVFPEAIEAVAEALQTGGNPSSVHAVGRKARSGVEAARAQVARLVDAAPSQVVFTSGASEANVLALRGLPAARVWVSDIEHDSVLNAAADAGRLPVTANGCLDLTALQELVSNGDLVSVMAVNNETGIIQPLEDIAQLVAEAGARLHIDAVQAAGRMALSFSELKPAAISLSAHKLGGPPGIGALVMDEALSLASQTRGGGQERGRRGGTENTAGVAGFGAAAVRVVETRDFENTRLKALRDRLESGIMANVPSARVIGGDQTRVSNTCCLALPGVPAEKQVIALDLAGFAVSAGSACSSGKVKTSHVLNAMGLSESIAGSSIRISLGWRTVEAEIDGFIVAYSQMAERVLPKESA